MLYFLALVLAVFFLLYLFWRFNYFFRDPERIVPPGDENIVSAADGTIIYIKELNGLGEVFSSKKGRKISLQEFCDEEDVKVGKLVGIFMHPTSVHVNRAPIDGVIEKIDYKKGKNLPMTITWWRTNLKRRPYEKYAEHIASNERNIISIKGKIRIFIVQIADIYVNKIECWVKKDQLVKRGQRIGMIKMGSQVDMFLPKGVDVKVRIGEKVKAGETIIGKL